MKNHETTRHEAARSHTTRDDTTHDINVTFMKKNIKKYYTFYSYNVIMVA